MGELRVKDKYLAAVLRGEEKLLLDGGMGTLLMAAGLFREGHVADILCIENPEGVTRVQKGYVESAPETFLTKYTELYSRLSSGEKLSFELDGSHPSFVDMPVWYTHNITNIGTEDLYTIFWINEFYDPNDPDTFFEEV